MDGETDDTVEYGLAEGADGGEDIAHEVEFAELFSPISAVPPSAEKSVSQR